MKTTRTITIILLTFILALNLACSLGKSKEEPAPTQEAAVQIAPTSAAPEPESTVQLGELRRFEQAGFAMRVIPGYEVEDMDGFINMLAPGADPDIGPVITVIGGITVEQTTEQLFEQFKSGVDMTIGEPEAITIAGLPGLTTEINGESQAVAIRGRVAMLMVTADQQFALLAGAPEDQWTQVEPYFAALLASIEFFEPAALTESQTSGEEEGSEQDPGYYLWTNANVVRDVVISGDTAYTATLGGMVAWNFTTGFGNKKTTIQGMQHVSSYAITVCDIPQRRVLVGTREGLSIYDPDAMSWTNENLLTEETQMSKTKITRLYCDSANQRLLISFGGAGFGVLELSLGEFTLYTKDEGLAWNDVTDIEVVGRDIWVASGYKGVAVISDSEVLSVTTENSNLPDDLVYSLAVTPDGTIWMGASSGLIKFDGVEYTLYGADTSANLKSISELTVSEGGKIWAGTMPIGAGRICQFDPASQSCVLDYRAGDGLPIQALAMHGEVPVYGTSKGLYRNDGSELEYLVPYDTLVSNFVDVIAGDPDGSLWIGTDMGVQRIDPFYTNSTPWETYQASSTPGMGGSWATGIAFAPDGAVWFSIMNGKATRFMDGAWTAYDGLTNLECLAIDSQGRVWFGDDSKGITVIDPDGSQVMTLTEAEGLTGNRVNALLAVGDTMWIASGQGLFKYQDEALQLVLGKDDLDLPSAYIVALARENDGALLVGANLGIVRFDDGQVETLINFQKQGVSAWLTNLAVAPDGRIWAGTQKGLYYSDDGSNWLSLSTADRLPTNYITALYVDQYGALWMGGGSNFDGGGLLRIVE